MNRAWNLSLAGISDRTSRESSVVGSQGWWLVAAVQVWPIQSWMVVQTSESTIEEAKGSGCR